MTRLSRPKTCRTVSSVSTSSECPKCARAHGNRHEMVGIAGSKVEIVQHHDDRRSTRAVEISQQIEHLRSDG